MESVPAHTAGPPITIRRAKPEDIGPCGAHLLRRFHHSQQTPQLPARFPLARGGDASDLHDVFPSRILLRCGRAGWEIVGSNCMDERSAIAGIGPITIEPSVQNRGMGRQLMIAVMDRAAERGFPPACASYKRPFTVARCLFRPKLGFDVCEPL